MDKADLLAAVATEGFVELHETLSAVAETTDPNERMVNMAGAYVRWAVTDPDSTRRCSAPRRTRASTEELLLELRRRIITPREAREVWEDWGGLNPRGDWPDEG